MNAPRTTLVAAAVMIEEGRVLITQRKAGAHLEGKWEFPGGKVEPAEDPRDALVRELKEELGIDADVGEVVDVTFHGYAGDAGHAGNAVLLLFFEATRRKGSPELRAIDVAAFKWAARDELDPAQFPPADVVVLKKVVERLGAPSPLAARCC